MSKKTNVPVFFSCDDNYIPFLSVTLESLKCHASKKNVYTIKVLHANSVSKDNQNRIMARYSRDNIFVEFVDISSYVEKMNSVFHTRDYYSKSTYYRLFIPNLYPEYDKAVYLDSDVVLLDDVANLYNIDLKDNYVGAIPDESVGIISEFIIYVKNRIGVPKPNQYFNAGILVMNLKKLCEIDFESIFIDMISKVKFDVAQDQDYLNAICRGNVRYIGAEWNKMPLPTGIVDEKDIKLIHFNLGFKPWKTDNVLYQKYFWHYARRSLMYKEILEIKQKSDPSVAALAEQQTQDLKALCLKQAMDDKENEKIQSAIKEVMAKAEENIKKNSSIPKALDRLEVLDKINEYEKQGMFDKDVEKDPPGKELMPGQVDYLGERLFTRFNSFLAYAIAKRYLNKLKKERVLVIKDFVGIENFQNLKSGAIITCNHFNAFDSFAMEECYFKSKQKSKHRKLYRVIKEGNYTAYPGMYGFLMRHCHTLPLSSNHTTMRNFLKAVDVILQRGDFILVYPEQSMWWNYRKPKPLKKSAYRFAVKNNVPVLPVFITMEDSDRIGPDGFPMQEYTMHISSPIYPDKNKSDIENVEYMKNKNFELWKDIYEDTYKEKLVYSTDTIDPKKGE